MLNYRLKIYSGNFTTENNQEIKHTSDWITVHLQLIAEIQISARAVGMWEP